MGRPSGIRGSSQSNSRPSGASWALPGDRDRKSTRLNSSHQIISYAVFCLKKKKKTQTSLRRVIYDYAHRLDEHLRAHSHERTLTAVPPGITHAVFCSARVVTLDIGVTSC